MENLRKIFFVFIIFFFALSVKSHSEVVKSIESQGNERITLETMVIFGDIQIGKNYESEDISLVIKKLYETDFFSNISIELEDGKLRIIVTENPIVNTIILSGEKAEKYTEAITEILNLREKASYVKNYVKLDINIIKEFYRSLGYYFVEIDAEIEQLEKNRVNILYSIKKGKKAKIAKIYFLGEKKVRDKRLRDIITSQEARFWKFISRNVYLNKERIELDKRLLKNYYRNKGYYEVDISSSNVEYSVGEGFILTFSINAGKRYKFKKISAEVAKGLDQSAFASLEKDFNKVIGKYYSQQKLTNILEKIDTLSEQKELQFINHRVIETLEDDGVEIKIAIFEGQKFLIERINIVGNNVTNDAVIRGEMIIDEGDPYSALLLNKSINELKARGIFGKVESKITEGSSPDLKVLEIAVEEKATGEIAAGAGVGTDGTAFMFGISENNWLGRGITLRSALNISTETISGNIAVSNPNFNYSDNAVYTSLDVSSSDRVGTAGYESSKTGFSLGTEFEQYENIFFSPSITASLEDIEVQQSASDEVKKMEGNFNNIDFTYGVTVDKRNQSFQPTEGYRAKFVQSLPVVMDSSSILNSFNVTSYHELTEDVIGLIKFYGTSVHGVDEDVRLTNRLFLPQNKLRGFNTRKVGPKDGDEWVGGNYVAAFGLEAQMPKLLPESLKTDLSLFLDTANVWSVDYSSTAGDSSKIRSALGVAANVFTTIGPLSFVLAQDLTKAGNDETQTFNFRIGTSF